MEKRFTRIGAMSFHNVPECPISIEEVGLWRDHENDVLFLSPKMKNEYPQTVSKLIIGYTANDVAGTVIEEEKGYVIDDIVEEDGCFGQDLPITLQQNEVASGRFYLEEVTFADGYIWAPEEEKKEDEPEEDAEVTMVKTLGGFGPEGATFRKIPLSAIIAQRTTTQFITTIIAVIVCVLSLANCIAFVRQSDEKITDQLVELMAEAEFEEAKTDKDAEAFIERNHLVSLSRKLYIGVSVLMGITILFKLYMVFFLRETKTHLKSAIVKDEVLTVVVKRMNFLSIIQLVLSVLCNFNFFGIFAGISGLSVASLHRRIMKTKNKERAAKV